jgi:hypothetical protein
MSIERAAMPTRSSEDPGIKAARDPVTYEATVTTASDSNITEGEKGDAYAPVSSERELDGRLGGGIEKVGCQTA